MNRGYAAIGLANPKSGENVGGTLRAAGCYGAAMVAVSGPRVSSFIRHPTDTMKAWRHVPVVVVEDLRLVLPYRCIPVAVEMSEKAWPLPRFRHPERAFYLFGPEDGSLDEEVMEWCSQVVYIPTQRCMNLAACVNVVLYDRLAKQGEVEVEEPNWTNDADLAAIADREAFKRGDE